MATVDRCALVAGSQREPIQTLKPSVGPDSGLPRANGAGRPLHASVIVGGWSRPERGRPSFHVVHHRPAACPSSPSSEVSHGWAGTKFPRTSTWQVIVEQVTLLYDSTQGTRVGRLGRRLGTLAGVDGPSRQSVDSDAASATQAAAPGPIHAKGGRSSDGPPSPGARSCGGSCLHSLQQSGVGRRTPSCRRPATRDFALAGGTVRLRAVPLFHRRSNAGGAARTRPGFCSPPPGSPPSLASSSGAEEA
jgi:hypothetical protein